MLRHVAYSVLLGSALASLASCSSFFDGEEREAWRAEVEAACLASGEVHETAGIRLAQAVEGPGACGVDRPFRVTALDEGAGPAMSMASMSQMQPIPPRDLPQQDLPQQDLPQQDPAAGPAYDPYPAQPGYTPLPELPAGAPVRMTSAGPFAVSLDKSVLLSCSMIPATTRWLAGDVQPAALAAFGSPVVEMTSFGSYSCRRRNNAHTGRLSEHAFANAIDVKGFRLADGRETKVLTGWRGTPEEQAFWRDVAYGACRTFTTVLGPGTSGGLHENHLHLDLARHSSERAIHVCRPRVPQDWVAQARRNGTQPEPPAFTGSIVEPLRGEDDQ